LFKNRTTQRNTNEILFFITPRIYRPDAQGNPMSGVVSPGSRSTTVLQPVQMGNPPSNSGDPTAPVQQLTQPIPAPVAPQQQMTQPQTLTPRPE
jgi:type II secretory pathway component GspD/PulD (secretin)